MIDLVIDFDKEKDKKRLFEVLKVLKGVHAVSLKKWRKSRSTSQNRYYWGVVISYLSSETGYTREEVHQEMQRMFLRYDKELPNGTTKEFFRSTTSLDKMDMEVYLEQIRIFAISELGCYIPLPNEIVFPE